MPALKRISGKEFILMLKKHPCLYDRSHPEFAKLRPSSHAWNILAEQTGRRGKFQTFLLLGRLIRKENICITLICHQFQFQ